jgi:hypothetical protein
MARRMMLWGGLAMLECLRYSGGRGAMVSSSTAQATTNGGVWRGTGRVWSVHAQVEGKGRTRATGHARVLARPGLGRGAVTACLARRGEVLGACVLASSVRLFA